jgi:carbamoyltransferase
VEIVGICGDCEHNSSVALFRDGDLVYAEAEERFSRSKGDGDFPRMALREALSRSAGGKLVIAAVGIEANGLRDRRGVDDGIASPFGEQVKAVARETASPIRYVEHHRAHALTARYFSSEGHTSIVTADGQGDSLTATFSTWSPQKFQRKWSNSVQDGSLGFFFAAITELLGYRRLRDEGKVTALAAAGEYVEELRKVFSEVVWNDLDVHSSPRLRVNPRFVREYTVVRPLYTAELASRVAAFRREDIAFAAQERLEEVMVELLLALPVPPGQLALAGGLFGNVRLNYRIAERLPFLSSVSIAPPMGDEGLSIGAALEVLFTSGIKANRPLGLALGRAASILRIESILDQFPTYNAIEVEPDKVSRVAAELLALGLPVARCSGRGEFGPRALGNRSLLYRPDDPSSSDWLNRVLGRDNVMPFAPCIREEDLATVTPVDSARYTGLADMTVAVPALSSFQKACPGVVHSDGTVRVQSVGRGVYPGLWDLLGHFKTLTGLPALLNTSLNRHGEPIVGSSLDALTCVVKCGLPILVVDDAQVVYARKQHLEVARAFERIGCPTVIEGQAGSYASCRPKRCVPTPDLMSAVINVT